MSEFLPPWFSSSVGEGGTLTLALDIVNICIYSCASQMFHLLLTPIRMGKRSWLLDDPLAQAESPTIPYCGNIQTSTQNSHTKWEGRSAPGNTLVPWWFTAWTVKSAKALGKFYKIQQPGTHFQRFLLNCCGVVILIYIKVKNHYFEAYNGLSPLWS